LAFSDNNQSLYGIPIDGIPVLSPIEVAKRFGNRAIFIVTIWHGGGTHRLQQVRKQLIELGCVRVASFAFLFWKYSEIFLPYYSIGLPHGLLSQSDHILSGYNLWEDNASREEYIAEVNFRLHLDFDGLPSPVGSPQYFADGLFELNDREVYVDCGAYNGDTLQVFYEHHPAFKGTYYAIEPDPRNFRLLEEYAAGMPVAWRGRVKAFQTAVGVTAQSTVHFMAEGTVSSTISTSGTIEVSSTSLDNILGGIQPTFIKMDIEGAEVDALEGARISINKSLPILAICLYHQPDHLWKIPLLIKSFSEEYRFFLRPHNEEGWDTVCYAVPSHRLVH